MRRWTLLLLLLAALAAWLAVRDPGGRPAAPAPPRDDPVSRAADPATGTGSAPAPAGPAAASSTPVEPGPGAVLAGVVILEPEGAPADCALVRVVADRDGSEEAIAESDGTFRVEDVPAGAFRLMVWAPDRAEYAGPELSLAAGEERTDLRVGLGRGGTIFGTVASRGGTPVFRRAVIAERGAGGEARGETDVEGGYEFSTLLPGRGRVRPEGWPGEWVDLADGESALRDFAGPEPATLSVALVDATGAPVQGHVLLRRPDEPWEDQGFFGSCVFRDLDPGAREIWAGGQARSITLADGEKRTETFRFEPASVGGRAIFEGEPYVREAWVRLRRLDSPLGEGSGGLWRTGPDGAFRIDGVLPGEFELTASEGEAESVPLALTLRARDSRLGLELRVLEPRAVAIRLIDWEGASPASLSCALFRGSRWVASGDFDDRGRAELNAIPGRYTLRLYPVGAEECAAEKEIEVHPRDRNGFSIELR